MAEKKSVGRTNSTESSRSDLPTSEEEPVPLQNINPLAIEMYNPENVPPVESMVSTEFDTFDEDQHVEENLEDGEVQNDEENSNDVENQNVEENPKDGEVHNNEENQMLKIIHLMLKKNVDTYVAEIIAKA